MEQLNLTVRSLESKNSALESQCIQLEHQNFQMVEERKKLKERLQGIETFNQKTMQEKMQYNANHQHLSHQVMYNLYIHALMS